MDSQTEERIESVENGLLQAIVMEGETPKRMALSGRMAHYRVPGLSVAVINERQVEWAKGYGVMEAAGSARVGPDTLFQAASISKPVAALGSLSLAERGVLGPDDDVNRSLRSWKLPDNELTDGHPVTARRILSHTAGLTVHGFPGYPAGYELPTLRQILDGTPPANTGPVRVEHEPGSRFQYSGGGTVVLQQVICDVTGQPFPDVMSETVLAPLRMEHSTFEQPLPDRLRAAAASGHRSDGSVVEGKWHVYPEMAAAGLWTTPSDLARFAIELLLAWAGESDRVVSQATAREMLTPQGGGPVGLGPFLEGSGSSACFSHAGANEGYRCELIGVLERGQGAVVMTNSDEGQQLVTELINAVADVYGWPFSRVRTVVAVDPSLYDRYAGAYEVNEQFVITISRERDRLVGEAPGLGKLELHAASEADFFLTEVPAKISFQREADGEVAGLRVHGDGFEMEARKR
jgi:CubicO group peptidase (beta-lactamase class C family)